MTMLDEARLDIEDVPTIDELIEQGADALDDPKIARALMLRLRETTAEREQLVETLAWVQEPYKLRLETLNGRQAAARDLLRLYCERNGKISFPDLGSAHLTTRAKGGKAKVADLAAFEDYVKTILPDVWKAHAHESISDARGALEQALNELGVATTAAGALVDVATGEVAVEGIPGVEVEPESKTIAVSLP